MTESHGSFTPKHLPECQIDEVLREKGRPNRTDLRYAEVGGWTVRDLERVTKARYEYARTAREYGEEPGSPALDAYERWIAAARVAKKRAEECEGDDPRRDHAAEHRVKGYTKDDGERVRPHLAKNPRRKGGR